MEVYNDKSRDIMKGSIEVICGPMFSGKTEELMKRMRRTFYAKQSSMNFKPAIDNRYGHDAICSHDKRTMSATVVNNSGELEVAIENYRAAHSGELPDVIGVEEVQFFDEQIVQTLYDLKCEGARVIVAGLDMDWQGAPFGITATLMAVSDKVDKQQAVCTECGDDATHSYLKNKTTERIQVGEKDLYEARCFEHWRE